MEENKIRQRNEIPVEDTWALEDLYASDAAWEAELATISQDQTYMVSFAGRLNESAETLYAYLERMEQVNAKGELLANYCMRKSDEDTRNGTYQAMVGKFMSMIVGFSAATSFETPELMTITDDELNAFYAAEPRLERYRRYLTDLRRRKEHVLSPAEEKLLAAAGEMAQAPQKSYGAFANADIKFDAAVDSEGKEHPLSQGTFVPLEESADRVLRKSAYENLYHGFGNFKNTAASMLNAQASS